MALPAARFASTSRIASSFIPLAAGTSRFDHVTTDLPPLPRLDAAGNLSFRFGGRLFVTGDADGQFRGDLPITVEYL